MANFVRVGTRYINIDKILCLEETPTGINIVIEKSFILTFQKSECKELLELIGVKEVVEEKKSEPVKKVVINRVK